MSEIPQENKVRLACPQPDSRTTHDWAHRNFRGKQFFGEAERAALGLGLREISLLYVNTGRLRKSCKSTNPSLKQFVYGVP